MIWWAFVAAYLVLSVFVMGRYLIASNLGDTWRGATIEQMVSGTAERPYVYRRLVPEMTALIKYIMPAEWQRGLGETAAQLAQGSDVAQAFAISKRMFKQALENTDTFFSRSVAAVVAYGFLWLFIVSSYQLGARLYPDSYAMRLCLPVIGLLMIPALLVPTAFVYDLPALGLASACFWALALKRWGWFFVWFILACLNKETAIFTSIFFGLYFYSRMERREFFMLLALQLTVFALIRGVIYIQFMENSGIFLNTAYMAQQTALWMNGYGYKTLATLFFIAFLLTFRWQEKPEFARPGIVLLALMYGAYFLFGRPDEYRVFLDVMPLLAVLITHTLVESSGLSRSALFASASSHNTQHIDG